ncbi:LytR/AlgR family response regulator transcription factor [Emticicia fontis]
MTQPALIRLGWHHKIDPNTILFMRSDSNYTMVHLHDGSKILSATTLGILAKRLPPYKFFRASRSVLINLDCIVGYEKKEASVKLSNNEVIQVSRRRNKHVRRSIKQKS